MPIDAVRGANLVAAALKSAGEATGVGFDVLYNMARRESALNPDAKAATSSAAGLFQFIEQTWLGAVRNYGARHGMGDAASHIAQDAHGRFVVAEAEQREAILNLRFDPSKAAALAGELISENRRGLEKALGRAVDAAELYAAHFLGLNGATKLLTAAPDAEAAALLPKAAAANKPVFYAGARAKTVGEVVASIAKSMNVEAPQNSAAAPVEIKSAAPFANLFASARKSASPRIAAHAAPLQLQTLPSLAELFGWRSAPALQTPSALAFAVLQALNPAELGNKRAKAE
jgi:hypothetical protein